MTTITTPTTASATRSTVTTLKKKPEILKYALAVWTALVIILMIAPIALVVLHSFNRSSAFVTWSGHVTTEWWGRLFNADKAWPAVVKIIGITLVGSLIPFVVRKVTGRKMRLLSAWAGPASLAVALLFVGLSTSWFHDIFREKQVGDALRNTFISALGATVIAVFLGGTAGVALARRHGAWTKPFMFVVFLILVTPEIMEAIALAGWMQRVGGPFNNSIGFINNGIIRLWVGQSMYASAVVTLIVRARLSGIDESLEEAAADLGANPATAFRQITLPLISSALIAGGLLSFTLCLDNTVVSNLINTAGSSTFPTYLISSSKSALKPFVGSAAVVLFIVTFASLGFVGIVLKRSGESSSQIAATLAGG